MKIEEFHAGSTKQQYKYKSFSPSLINQEQIVPEKRDDWQEVQNYVAAINYAIEKLKQLPLSCRLIKETHGILLQEVRGEYKTPGEFRRSQNWIGGSSLQDAIFIPPHDNEIPESGRVGLPTKKLGIAKNLCSLPNFSLNGGQAHLT